MADVAQEVAPKFGRNGCCRLFLGIYNQRVTRGPGLLASELTVLSQCQNSDFDTTQMYRC